VNIPFDNALKLNRGFCPAFFQKAIMSETGKYVPRKLVEAPLNAMTNVVLPKATKYTPPSLKKEEGSLFPELAMGPVITKPKLSFAALLKPKNDVVDDTIENVIDESNTVCESCHTCHITKVIDISDKTPYVPDPYYAWGRRRWTHRPPTAVKRRSLFDNVDGLEIDDADLAADGASDGNSLAEPITDDDSSEPYDSLTETEAA